MSQEPDEPTGLRGVTLRRLRPEDLRDVIALIAEHAVGDAHHARRHLERQLALDPGQEHCPHFVAVFGGVLPIGVCGLERDPEHEVLWIDWCYVQRTFHGLGIGRLLIERTLAAARRLGAAKVFVDVSADRGYREAVAFYQRAGFREEARLPDYYSSGEDMLVLAVELSSSPPPP